MLSQWHTWRFYTPFATIFTTDWCGYTWWFFSPIAAMWQFWKSWDEIAQPDGLALLATRSNDRKKSRERALLANNGEFNRRYLTCQISAILYADRGDRRTKSPSVSLALIQQQVGRFHHMTFQNCHIAAIGEKNCQVCPHQSVVKIACDFRRRSNSPRSAYKIARFVAGFRYRRLNSLALHCQ